MMTGDGFLTWSAEEGVATVEGATQPLAAWMWGPHLKGMLPTDLGSGQMVMVPTSRKRDAKRQN